MTMVYFYSFPHRVILIYIYIFLNLGHGGKEVAHYCKEHFLLDFVKTPQFNNGNYVGALRETFHAMDVQVDDEVRVVGV
jgi:hypothetical protein